MIGMDEVAVAFLVAGLILIGVHLWSEPPKP